MKTLVLALVITLINCTSCNNKQNNKNDNVSTTISSDITKLSKILNFKVFAPYAVKFQYILIDNSTNNKRLSVPGPSDSYLNAVLYFDSLTFKNLKSKYYNVDYVSQGLNKENFNFDFLEENIKKELQNSDTSYHGHPDIFFSKGGKLWLLNNKVLLRNANN